jgi:hypothetical protein
MKSWKVQKFFADVVYDLRSRGLLPVAVLLVVGIFAAPILIARGGESAVPPTPGTTAGADVAPETQAAVLSYNPGVRNYKERLDDLASKDPFEQQFTVPEAATTAGAGGDSAGATVEGEGTGGGTGSGQGSDVVTTPSGEEKIRYFRYEADVESGEADGDMDTDKHVKVFTYLPSEAAPVIVYLGTSLDKQASFLVNKDVLSADGSGDCIPAPDSCQLLTLEQGESEDLVYGVDGKTYRIKVLKVKLKVTGKLPKE